MISKELSKIIDMLKTQGKMAFLDGVTIDQILQFESEYNIKLPHKYREWLQFSDGGEFFIPAGLQLYGIDHKPLIDINNNDRPNDNYIVIGALANGDPILCEEDSEKISIYNHEAGRIEIDEIYIDFYAFLYDLNDILGLNG